MKKKMLGFIAFAAIAIVAGCNSPKIDTLSRFESVFPIKSQRLNVDSYKIKSFGKMRMVDSENCIVKENSRSESLIDLIFFKRDSIIPFAKLGNGPNEFIMPRIIQTNKENDVEIYDIHKKQLVTQKLSGEIVCSQNIKYQSLSLIKVNEGFVLSGNIGDRNFENKRYTLLDKDGEYIDSFGFFPDDQIDCPYDIKMFAYQGWMVYNSELNRFASVSFSGSILEIYQLQNNPSLIRKYHDLYPMYRNKSIAKTKGIQYTEENIIGYVDIYSTNKYIFTLYSGSQLNKKNNEEMHHAMTSQNILVFDWNGDCVCRLISDKPLFNICVSEDNKRLIALGWDDDYYLYSFDLSKVNLLDN
ncbi:MAG: hypothetical protein IJD84_07205 [Parabacteroides sp.]|nr:hypothetical protein [Parabacteroides sp.]